MYKVIKICKIFFVPKDISTEIRFERKLQVFPNVTKFQNSTYV